jgi:hypothetical protein
MQADTVAAAIIFRMTAWGLAGGAAGGAIYAVIIFAVTGSGLTCIAGIIGFLVGGVVGGSLGLLNGIVLGGFTRMELRSQMRFAGYRALVCSESALLTGTGALFGFPWALSAPFELSDGWIVYILIPALIAAVVAVVATARVVGWVENDAGSLLRVE